jgi:hypothetical protein
MTLTATAPRRAPAAPRVRRPVVSEVIVILFLLRIYDVARAHADVRRDHALRHAQSVLDLERLVHLDPEHAVNAALHRHAHLSTLAVSWYQYLHIPVTLAVLLALWLLRPALYRPLRTALVLLNVVGLAVFLLWPLAPPRLLPGAGFIDSVSSTGHAVGGSEQIPLDQYGAMPSLHIAWAVWSATALVLLLHRYRLRHLAWLYPLTTAVVVVATANHYVADVAAGGLTALCALQLALRTSGRVGIPVQRRSAVDGASPARQGSAAALSTE